MKKTLLKKYARLIAQAGANVKKGDKVIIRAELDQPQFVTLVAEECYKLGAAKVEVDFSHMPLTAIHIKYRSEDILADVEEWEHKKLERNVAQLPVMIYLLSEAPDALNGIDFDKYASATAKRRKVIKTYRDQMEDKYKWVIAAVPGAEWAKSVFPDEKLKSRAIERLWEAILYCARVADSEDPVKTWHKHENDLAERCAWLNSLELDSLEYTASNGTHLTVGLIPTAQFMGGCEITSTGKSFSPNIPTEEVFVTPMRGKTDGIVYSSRPLVYDGIKIEDFYIEFKNGRAVASGAKKNGEVLEKLLNMDEGASYLGECALVPYDSPISNSGILFYNTLFDENASCHLALGRGFGNCLKNYDSLSLEEIHNSGINDSIIHEDFMIGTADMTITGHTRDGKTVKIFENGNWANS